MGDLIVSSVVDTRSASGLPAADGMRAPLRLSRALAAGAAAFKVDPLRPAALPRPRSRARAR